MTQTHYCKSWFSAKKRAIQPWDEEQARSAHEGRLPYTVLVGDPESPHAVLLVSGKMNFVGVDFLDERLREALSYSFKEIEPGTLFLSMATYREFDGDEDSVLGGTSYIFKPDGGVIIRREAFDPHTLEKSETNADVSGNYEAYPSFGDYERLCLIERGSPDGADKQV
ncbi:MAG: hypothetical protein ACR2PM_19900 [Hyphomicrobiales bacterium]